MQELKSAESSWTHWSVARLRLQRPDGEKNDYSVRNDEVTEQVLQEIGGD